MHRALSLSASRQLLYLSVLDTEESPGAKCQHRRHLQACRWQIPKAADINRLQRDFKAVVLSFFHAF